MFLSKHVVRLYSLLLEISLWFTLIIGFVGGWGAYGFMGAIGGLIVAALFGATFFGAFLVFDDMRRNVQRLVDMQKLKEGQQRVES